MPAYCFSSASLRLLFKMASRSQRRLVAAFILPDRDSLNKPCSDWTTKRNSALTGPCHWSVPLLRHLLRSSGATSMPVQTEGPHQAQNVPVILNYSILRHQLTYLQNFHKHHDDFFKPFMIVNIIRDKY